MSTAPQAIPVAVEMEMQVIGLCLRGCDPLPDDLPALPPQVWEHPVHAEAWATITRLHAEGARYPTPHQVGALMGHRSIDEVSRIKLVQHLDTCTATAPIVGARALQDTLHEHAAAVRNAGAKRQLAEIGIGLSKLAQDPALSASEAIASIDNDLIRLRTGELVRPTPLRELVTRLADELERPVDVMSTGIAGLDEVLAGGIWSGKLYGIKAMKKVGKTLLLATIARNVAQRQRVLYIALEMGQAEVAQRVIADRIGCNSVHFLQRNDPTLADRLIGYASRSDRPELDNLLFHDAPGCTFTQLKTICQSAVRHSGVRLVVLDYWQLVQGIGRGQSETQHLGEVAQWLANFARKHSIAVLTAAQVNRDGLTRGSEGLDLACDWFGHLQPANPNTDRDRWLEATASRYTMLADLGTADNGALTIDPIGPVFKEWG